MQRILRIRNDMADKKNDYTDEKGKLKKGNPGRPKGSKNKSTLKQAYIEAFFELGGKDALVKFAKLGPKQMEAFLNQNSKMLPKEVELSGPDKGPIETGVVALPPVKEKGEE